MCLTQGSSAGRGLVYLGEMLAHRPLPAGLVVPEMMGWLGGATAFAQLAPKTPRYWRS